MLRHSKHDAAIGPGCAVHRRQHCCVVFNVFQDIKRADDIK